jgi:hypothetical protein
MLKDKKVFLSIFILVIIAFSVFSFLDFKIHKVNADPLVSGSTDKVLYGKAWVPNFGFLSFNNCTDPTSSSTCTSISYQVKIDSSKNLDGWAWLSYYDPTINNTGVNAGSWVQFGTGGFMYPVVTGPDGVSGAKVTLDGTGDIVNITGWARAINSTAKGTADWNGWDGLISFDSSSYYGVGVTGSSTGSGVTKTQSFKDYAWGGPVLGAVDFSGVSAIWNNIVSPSCTLVVTPASPIPSNTSFTISWYGNDLVANKCTTSGGARPWPTLSGVYRATSGAVGMVLGISSPTTYIMSCLGTDGLQHVCSTKVNVAAPLPTVDLQASPTSVANGQDSSISWVSTGTTSCSVTKNGSAFASGLSGGPISSGALYSSTTFTAMCHVPGFPVNPDISDSKTVMVDVFPGCPTGPEIPGYSCNVSGCPDCNFPLCTGDIYSLPLQPGVSCGIPNCPVCTKRPPGYKEN